MGDVVIQKTAKEADGTDGSDLCPYYCANQSLDTN